MMKPNISMFFPAYNEEENIPILLKSALKVLKEYSNDYEILVIVYEGTTDNTINEVKKFSKINKKVKLIIQPKTKKGVGYANIMGFRMAKFPYVFYADSDNQFDLNEFKSFIPFIDKYDVIAGYRKIRHDPTTRIFVSKFYNLLMKILFRVKEKDLDCAFRLVSKKVLDDINLMCVTGLATTELLAKARRKGFKIKEIPVTHFERKLGLSVFEGELFNFPKFSVISDLIKEMKLLKKDLNKIKKVKNSA